MSSPSYQADLKTPPSSPPVTISLNPSPSNLPPAVAVPQSKPPPPSDYIPFEFVRNDRTLVVCFDGTGDQFDKDNSNVVEFLSLLQKDDRTRQMVYYQSGIGTYTGKDNTASNLTSSISRAWDEAVAWNISNHVKEGYTFLMQNYIKGDRISLFGFSRGAFTARALAGMVHKIGLLPPGNEQQVPFAYNLFVRTDNDSWDVAEIFKNSFAIDAVIDFVGVWDTVRSVGLLDIDLPFSASNNSIRAFRHAVSLDEHRAKFKSNHWNPPSADDRELGTKYHNRRPTDVKEVWFCGVHTDVGGGSVVNDTRRSLAKIPLRWMVKECFRCKTGILFKADETRKKTGLTPDLLKSPALDTHTSNDSSHFSSFSSGITAISEDESELFRTESEDALEPMNDQLVQKKAWWVLEYLPLRQATPGIGIEDRKQMSFFKKTILFFREHRFNNGEGRLIPMVDTAGNTVPLFVHHSVSERIANVVEKEAKSWWPFNWQATVQYIPKAANWDNHDIQAKIIWTD